jgi:hypothetical protein
VTQSAAAAADSSAVNKHEKGIFDKDEPDVTAYSFEGISQERFPDNVVKVLMDPIDPKDVEIKPGKGFLLCCPSNLFSYL